MNQYDLSRYVTAQQRDYQSALTEIKNGKKVSHWMWYIFPQIRGLGKSSTSQFYAIQSLDEAKAFLEHLTSDIILSKFRKLYLAWIQAMHMKFLENQIT